MSLSKLKAPSPPMVDLNDAHDAAVVGVPRLIRHALQAINGSIEPSVACEVAVLCPEMARVAEAWVARQAGGAWRALAAGLDERAIRDDEPAVLGLADSVRLASMTVDDARARPDDAIPLSRSLQAAKRVAGKGGTSAEVLAVVEQCMIGWLYLATSAAPRSVLGPRQGHAAAHEIGQDMTEAVEIAAES